MEKWVILHKVNETAADWGFTGSDVFGRAVGHDRIHALTVGELPDPAALSVVVISPTRWAFVLRGLDPSQVQELERWKTALAAASCHVWVHFGGVPTQDMTLDWIQERWCKLTKWSVLASDLSRVRPYSYGSGGRANEQIKSVRALFKETADGKVIGDAGVQKFHLLLEAARDSFGRSAENAAGYEHLVSVQGAYIAFQQVLIHARLEAGAGRPPSSDNLRRLKDALALARRLTGAARSLPGEWLLALEAVAGSPDDTLAEATLGHMRRFCATVQSAARTTPAPGQ